MKLHNRLFYLLLLALRKVIELCPQKTAFHIGRKMGALLYYFLPSRRDITVDNLRKAFPEEKPQWHRYTARRAYENFGRNLMEFIKFAAGRFRVEAEGLERLSDGALLLTGHLGNWELTGMAVTESGMELYPVGRRIHNQAADRIVNEIRTVFGSYHIPYRRSIRKILRKLNYNKNICVLVDQRIRGGLPAVLFNRPVWVTHLPSVLHRRTGVDIVPGYSYHDKSGLKVKYGKPLEFISGPDTLKSDFINTNIQMKWVEERIREHPDEWFWLHNFWKDRWPAVFLDRDGTVIEDTGYIGRLEDVHFLSGAFEALRDLKKAGYLLIVVTNQSGIARGYYTEEDYHRVNDFFLKSLYREGIIVDRVYYCPHHPDEHCDCRKPETGMIEQAAGELHLDISDSYMIGDKESDMELARKTGMKGIMISENNNTEGDYSAVSGLEGAVRIVAG